MIAASTHSHEPKWNPTMIDPQTPPLSAKGPFVWYDPVDSMIRGNKAKTDRNIILEIIY